ncbi:MAG TPA: hypothetical protein O0X39_00755 [Methanocorpusculum sp.]|nr:hypothetical protein [Methanocorpusculum sp.]
MPISSHAPDLNDKTVVKGQKGPSPYRLAIFCTLGFCVAVLVIILAILAPLHFFTDMTSTEIIGITSNALDEEVIQLIVMTGSRMSELEYLAPTFDGVKPIGYSAPDSYTAGTTVYYLFPSELKGKTGKLEIFGHFKNGNNELLYSETITMK